MLMFCWLVASLTVGKLLERYRNPRTTHHTILLAVFLCWLFPISITFLLPIDISSTRYEQCLSSGGETECTKSWLYVDAAVRHASWLVVYWATFVLSWIFVPFLQGYVVAGAFDMFGKVWYSLGLNLLFYGVLVLILAVMVVYLRVFTTITTWEGIGAFLMALSNAAGLLAVLLFLGHGLVRIPRRLWHSSNANLQLRKFESRALAKKEHLHDAEDELAGLTGEIQALPYRTRHHPELQSYVDELLAIAPVPSDDELLFPRQRSPSPNQGRVSIDLNYLEQLNYKIKEAISTRDRAAWEWRSLLESAWYWQDVQSNTAAGKSLGWQSSVEAPRRVGPQKTIMWWWHVYIRPASLRALSIFCIFLSFVVFWSEVTLPVTDADLSLVRPLIGVRIGTVETMAAALLLYLALCTYSSFLKLRVLSYFHLVPGQHTDEKSLLFFAAYITRLTFPLGYNYVTLVDRALHTEFAKVMGTMDLVPLLGRYFNLYVPLSLSIVCVIVAFRLHKHVSDQSDAEADLIDGRELIMQARRLEERECHARLRLYSSNLSNWRVGRPRSFCVDSSLPSSIKGGRQVSPVESLGSRNRSSTRSSSAASASNVWTR